MPYNYFAQEEGFRFATVPLKINVGEQVFVDNDDLQVAELLQAMKECKTASSTACPAPYDFAEEYRKADYTFVFTISSQLSGTYNSAVVAKKTVEQEDPSKKIHVVDSKATSAMQMLLIFRIKKLIQENKYSFEELCQKIDAYQKELGLYFVLQSYDNLIKAGRMSKTAAALAGVLSICPVAGENGNGQIQVFCKVRGAKAALKRMVEMIKDKMPTQREHLVITHCNNIEGAKYVAECAKQIYQFAKIDIFPMRGLASYYANDKGIIIGF